MKKFRAVGSLCNWLGPVQLPCGAASQGAPPGHLPLLSVLGTANMLCALCWLAAQVAGFLSPAAAAAVQRAAAAAAAQGEGEEDGVATEQPEADEQLSPETTTAAAAGAGEGKEERSPSPASTPTEPVPSQPAAAPAPGAAAAVEVKQEGGGEPAPAEAMEVDVKPKANRAKGEGQPAGPAPPAMPLGAAAPAVVPTPPLAGGLGAPAQPQQAQQLAQQMHPHPQLIHPQQIHQLAQLQQQHQQQLMRPGVAGMPGVPGFPWAPLMQPGAPMAMQVPLGMQHPFLAAGWVPSPLVGQMGKMPPGLKLVPGSHEAGRPAGVLPAAAPAFVPQAAIAAPGALPALGTAGVAAAQPQGQMQLGPLVGGVVGPGAAAAPAQVLQHANSAAMQLQLAAGGPLPGAAVPAAAIGMQAHVPPGIQAAGLELPGPGLAQVPAGLPHMVPAPAALAAAQQHAPLAAPPAGLQLQHAHHGARQEERKAPAGGLGLGLPPVPSTEAEEVLLGQDGPAAPLVAAN